MARGGTILIVDDEPANIEVLAHLLETEFEVLFATDGARALELAEADPPDMIILDVVMPGLDGYQVCERLKRNPATADVPVIFLTVKTDIEAETRGLQLGAVDYLAKPVRPGLVRAHVHNHIELMRTRRRLANRD